MLFHVKNSGDYFFRLADFYRTKRIIEMGSSLGISTAYLASADPSSKVITMEGSSAIAEIAKQTFIRLEIGNIQQITGNFDEKLTSLIESSAAADLVFIDGNHRKKPVLDYFEKFMSKISPDALIIIHDIHWSREMEEAWSIIQNDPRVKMSIDIFSAGFIFFRDEFKVKPVIHDQVLTVISLATHLPSAFIHSLSGLDHFDAEAFQAVHESGDQLVSVHMNPEKSLLVNEEWPETNLEAPFNISGKVPWATDAWYLAKRPSFTLDPLFHGGAYYVQEASGMFLSFALRNAIDLTRKLNILDLCASPGGKSTMIQSLISKDSLLVSNEVIKTRVPALHQNMTKWGYANGIVTNNDPSHFKKIPGFFDLLLIDAPCSGSGLFRKDPDAAKTWSTDLVKLCGRRQQRIIADVWDTLKEDGILIYSTCSYSKEENEDILDEIVEQYGCFSIPLSPDPSWNIVGTKSDQTGAYGYRFYPDKLAGEGFFLSVIQKKNAVAEIKTNKPDRNSTRIPKFIEQQISRWIKPGDYHYFTVGDTNHLLPSGLANELQVLKNALYLKKAGIRIGKPGENAWIPDHELALAAILRDEIPSLDLSKENALKFLRGESFDMGGIGKGWQLVKYDGFGLGWVKVLDTRMNNYYPKSWRIRQDF